MTGETVPFFLTHRRWLPILLALGAVAARAGAEEARVRDARLRQSATRAELQLLVEGKPRWEVQPGVDGTAFLLRIQDATIDPSVSDLAYDDGLVAEVEFWRGDLAGLSVRARETVVGSVTDAGDGVLSIRLDALSAVPVPDEPPSATLEVGSSAGHVIAAAEGGCAELRSSPLPSAAPITCLPSGTPVELVATAGERSTIRLSDGREGWVLRRQVGALRGDAAPPVGEPSGGSGPLAIGMEREVPAESRSAPIDEQARLREALEAARLRGDEQHARVEELDRLNAELAEHIEDQREEIRALREQLADSRSDPRAVERLEEQLAASRTALEAAEKDRLDQHRELRSLADRNALLADQLAAAAAQGEALQDRNRELESGRRELEDETEALRIAAARARTEEVRLHEEIDRLQRGIEALDAADGPPSSAGDEAALRAELAATQAEADRVQRGLLALLGARPAAESGIGAELAAAGRATLSGIHFASGSDRLAPESEAGLADLLAALEAAPALRLEIGGHTDAEADEGYNLDLSQRRAEAVRRWLVDRGADADRLTAVGYGEGHPVADNSTPEGRARNRRVEVVARVEEAAQRAPASADASATPP